MSPTGTPDPAAAQGMQPAAGNAEVMRHVAAIEALLKLENASLLPHVGSASVHTRKAMADLVVDNLDSWFSSGKALTPVPETQQVEARKSSR